jgi:hypothetical protein
MHQNSKSQLLTDTTIHSIKPLRSPRKFSDGGGLYLLVAPIGGRYWRYNYRFNGKQKTLALGIYPDVPLSRARARHQEARRLLDAGIDPAANKLELRSAAVLTQGATESSSRPGSQSNPRSSRNKYQHS